MQLGIHTISQNTAATTLFTCLAPVTEHGVDSMRLAMLPDALVEALLAATKNVSCAVPPTRAQPAGAEDASRCISKPVMSLVAAELRACELKAELMAATNAAWTEAMLSSSLCTHEVAVRGVMRLGLWVPITMPISLVNAATAYWPGLSRSDFQMSVAVWLLLVTTP